MVYMVHLAIQLVAIKCYSWGMSGSDRRFYGLGGAAAFYKGEPYRGAKVWASPHSSRSPNTAAYSSMAFSFYFPQPASAVM